MDSLRKDMFSMSAPYENCLEKYIEAEVIKRAGRVVKEKA